MSKVLPIVPSPDIKEWEEEWDDGDGDGKKICCKSQKFGIKENCVQYWEWKKICQTSDNPTSHKVEHGTKGQHW